MKIYRVHEALFFDVNLLGIFSSEERAIKAVQDYVKILDKKYKGPEKFNETWTWVNCEDEYNELFIVEDRIDRAIKR